MQTKPDQSFIAEASPLTLNQCAKETLENSALLQSLVTRVALLEQALLKTHGEAKPPSTYLGLPEIPGIDWHAVQRKYPKMKLDKTSAEKYHKHHLALHGDPSLKDLVEKQQALPRHKGIHYKQLGMHWGCTYAQGLAWIFLLKNAGLAKTWIEKDTYCRTDLEYKYNSTK